MRYSETYQSWRVQPAIKNAWAQAAEAYFSERGETAKAEEVKTARQKAQE
jgi:hypothetical protein